VSRSSLFCSPPRSQLQQRARRARSTRSQTPPPTPSSPLTAPHPARSPGRARSRQEEAADPLGSQGEVVTSEDDR